MYFSFHNFPFDIGRESVLYILLTYYEHSLTVPTSKLWPNKLLLSHNIGLKEKIRLVVLLVSNLKLKISNFK